MSEIGTEVAGLLVRADDAVTEKNWARAIDLARQILDRDPDNEDASAIVVLATRRAEHDRSTPATAERRQLTVMFADVVGSTAMANQLDIEDVRDILLEYQAACGEVVEAYDGTIARYIGDGLLIYFGFPRAHEDDPRRAVLAGLAMRSRVARLAEDVRDRFGVEFGARFGIHTGEVVVSDMGTDRWRAEADIIGPTANLAARLEGIATKNSVVMSAETAALASGFVEVDSLGHHEAKGFDDPIEVFQAIGSTAAADRIEAAVELTPFVGRADERRRLADEWRRIVNGESVTTFVVGEAGIGKSRLLHWMRYAGIIAEGRCLVARASTYEAARPFHVIGSAILATLNAFDDDDEIALKKLDDQLERFADMPVGCRARLASLIDIGVDDAVPDLSPEAIREATFVDIVAWFAGLAATEPTGLVLEDLHWADNSSLEAISRVVGAAIPRFHLVATSRPGELPTWADEARQLHLGPLPPDAASQLVDSIIAADTGAKPDLDRSAIVSYGDGIPLFLEELAKSRLSDAGVGSEVPTSMLDLLMARLTSLGHERETASLLATIADEVPRDVLMAISDERHDNVARDIDALVRAGLVGERRTATGSTISFRHALQRDAAYASQLKARRRERHAMLADRLPTEAPAFAAQRPALMAFHCTHADRPLEAVGYLQEAGADAASNAAHAEAIAHYGTALGLVESLEPTPEGVVLELGLRCSIGLASVISLGYTAPDSMAHWERAGELVRALGSPPETFLAMWGVWAFHLVKSDIDRSEQLAAEIDQMTADSDRPTRLFVETLLGEQELYCGRLHSCLEHSIAGSEFDDLEIAAQIANHPGLGAIANVGAMRAALGEIDAGLEAARESVELAAQIRFPLGAISEAFCAHRVAWSAYQCGRFDVATEYAARSFRVASDHGFVVWVGHGGAMLAAATSVTGDPTAAIPMLRAAIDGFEAVGARLGVGMYVWALARAHAAAGDVGNALAVADEGIRLVDDTHDRWFEPALLATRARAAALTGNEAGARADANAALDAARRSGNLLQELDAALALHDIGDDRADDALEHCLELLPASASNPDIDRARTIRS